MKLILIVVLIFAIVQTTLCCKFMKDLKDVHLCESWDELASAGSQPEWKKLVLKNSGKLEKTPLKNGAFKDFPNLENLWIEGLVNKVEPAVFKQLPKLKMLHLYLNEIEELPVGIFDGLQNLDVLEIKYCQLKNIKPGTVDKIKYVNLEGNKINPGTVFKNTEINSLDLSNNSISKIEDCAFCGMKNIQFLNLHDNLLTQLEPVRILGENSNIMGIGIDGNKLTKIPKFDSFPNFRGISAANNSIETIEDNSFANCPLFGLLEVSGNKLKDIPANIFPEFGDREDPLFLVIHQNEIQCLSQELRDKIKKLRRVTVNDNPWKCECLNDVIQWAKDRKAWSGCEFPIKDCQVGCVDKDNKKQIVKMN